MGYTMQGPDKNLWPEVPNGFPHPPRNILVTDPKIEESLDIRWDNPNNIPDNVGKFKNIIGVNIYRSFESSLGPYTKINSDPVGALSYRDTTKNIFVQDEEVTDNFISLDYQADKKVDALRTLSFKVEHPPIVKPDSRGTLANSFQDVEVWFLDSNGNRQNATVSKLNSLEGIVSLNTEGYLDPETLKIARPKVPDVNDPSNRVFVSYFYNEQRINKGLDYRIFYKLTTVAEDSEGSLIETPLEYVKGVDAQDFETLDYQWREAIRRNRWILEQGGERVQVMIRKWTGIPCACIDPTTKAQKNTCKKCYGTGIFLGYEGPFDMILPPPETERQIPLENMGYRLKYTYDCWSLPTPRLSERDIIVKPNGQRFIVGPVSPVSVRGVTIQQSFPIEYLEIDDIRYQVPVGGSKNNPIVLEKKVDERIEETVADPNKIPRAQEGKEECKESELSPYVTKKNTKSENEQVRGRTKTFENINY